MSDGPAWPKSAKTAEKRKRGQAEGTARFRKTELRRQFLPALETPAGKNVAAVGDAHALTEAMDLFPLPDLGLERHFHNTVPLSVNIQGRSRGALNTPLGGKSHSVTFSYYNRLMQEMSRAICGRNTSFASQNTDYIFICGEKSRKKNGSAAISAVGITKFRDNRAETRTGRRRGRRSVKRFRPSCLFALPRPAVFRRPCGRRGKAQTRKAPRGPRSGERNARARPVRPRRSKGKRSAAP